MKGEFSTGIFDSGNNTQVFNSGIIRSNQYNALRFKGFNPTLTLKQGSIIDGLVITNNPLNTVIQDCFNVVLTIEGEYGDLDIKHPYLLNENGVEHTLTVVCPSSLSMQEDILADLSDSILGNIYHNWFKDNCPCNQCDTGLFVQGFGSHRWRDSKNKPDYKNWNLGLLAGYGQCFRGAYVNLFGGLSTGEAKLNNGSEFTEVKSYFGGISYERPVRNKFFGTALVVGYIDSDNDRMIANNLVSNGIETAHSNPSGVFVSSEATLAGIVCTPLFNPQMSLTLRYATFLLNNTSETGSHANLKIKDRNIHLLTTRYEITLPISIRYTELTPYIGLYNRYQINSNQVDLELSNTPLTFNTGNKRNIVAFLFGFRSGTNFGKGDLFVNFEGSFDNDRSCRVLGELCFSYPF